MKRSVQEIVELVVFGAIALLIGTGLLWVAGWVFSGLGWLFQAVSGLVWRLLIVLVPIIIIAGLLYWLVNYLMKQRSKSAAEARLSASAPPAATAATPPASPAANAGDSVVTPPVTSPPPASAPVAEPIDVVTPYGQSAPAAPPEDSAAPEPAAPISDVAPDGTGTTVPEPAEPVSDALPAAADTAGVTLVPADDVASEVTGTPGPGTSATSEPADDEDRPLRNG